MKRLFLTMATCLAFTAALVAQSTQQTSPNNTPKPADSSPHSQQSSTGNAENKGEKKLKGCIRSENGKYVLETKHDKMVSLTGLQDFASHVGHTVTLHGKFVNNSSSAGAMSENPGTGTGDSTTTGAASPSTGSNSGAMSKSPGTGTGDSTTTGAASPSTRSNSAGAMSENPGTGTGDSTTTGAASPSTGSSSTGMSATGNSPSGEGSNFQVTKMDMVSDRCTLEGRNGMKGGKESSPDHR
jgi:hypothetical protein